MLSIRLLFLLFTFGVLRGYSQDFKVFFPLVNSSQHLFTGMLSDSSLISETYDDSSYENYLVRYDKRGNILHYTKIIPPVGQFYSPFKMIVSNDKITFGGRLDFIDTAYQSDSSYGYMMRFNACLEMEKYTVFAYHESIKHYSFQGFLEMNKFSENGFLVNGPSLLESDTIFNTVLCVDEDFKLRWHMSHMSFQNDMASVGENIYLWGYGEYLIPNDSFGAVGPKLNYGVLDTNGNVKSLHIVCYKVDGCAGYGGRIILSQDKSFLIGADNSPPMGGKFLELNKLELDGSILMNNQIINANEEEWVMEMCAIGDNKYLITTVNEPDATHGLTNLYIVDSNLSIIRKKGVLKAYPQIELKALNMGKNTLLYGIARIKENGVFKGILYMVDSGLNVVTLASIPNLIDSLCPNATSGQAKIMVPDTVWLDTLNLRGNLHFPKDTTTLINLPAKNAGLYPNPCNGNFSIVFDNTESGTIDIFNTQIQLLQTETFSNSKKIDVFLSSFPAGMYFVHISTANFTITKMLLIQ